MSETLGRSPTFLAKRKMSETLGRSPTFLAKRKTSEAVGVSRCFLENKRSGGERSETGFLELCEYIKSFGGCKNRWSATAVIAKSFDLI